jgi:hypothetical protein
VSSNGPELPAGNPLWRRTGPFPGQSKTVSLPLVSQRPPADGAGMMSSTSVTGQISSVRPQSTESGREGPWAETLVRLGNSA